MRSPSIQVNWTLTAIWFKAFSVVLVIFAAFCPLSFPADESDQASEDPELISEYIIGAGDVIQVTVWQYDEFGTTVTVGPDGRIAIPVLGDMFAAGYTREDLKKNITEMLTRFVREGAEVTVSVLQFNSQKIHIFGALENPRTITFSTAPPFLEVVIQSQFTPDADLESVTIFPEEVSTRKSVKIDVAELLRTGNTAQLPKLYPGDRIYIPRKGLLGTEASGGTQSQPIEDGTGASISPSEAEKPEKKFIIHVIGSPVGRPSSLDFPEEPTLIEVVLKAGSVSDGMTLRYLRIVRTGPGIGERIIDVNLEEYLDTGDVSLLPRLYSGDIIYFPDLTQEKVKEISIIITGQVLRPGTYRTSEAMNILDAISLAGGLAPDADPGMIRLTKENGDTYEEKIISIEDFIRDIGSTAVPEMVGPGYRIYVPTKPKYARTVFSGAFSVARFAVSLTSIYAFYLLVR